MQDDSQPPTLPSSPPYSQPPSSTIAPPKTRPNPLDDLWERAQPTSTRKGSGVTVHPLWLAVTTILIFGLVFGLVAALNNANAGSSAASSSASLLAAQSLEQTTINVIRQVDPSVVQIQASSSSGNGVGSGEILTSSGYIVTNDHVVHGSSRLSVLLADSRRFPAQLVAEAPTEDLALVKISALNLKPITIGNSDQVQIGQSVTALGSPLGLEQSATTGIVSALNRQVNESVDGQIVSISGLIQTSAPINPGNSGGALVNLQGELIGIPTLAAVDPTSGAAANGIGFAISSNRMITIIRQLSSGAA